MNETEENIPMFSNHVHTRHTRRMLTTAAVLPLFAVAACSSGDDGDSGGLEILGDSTTVATSPSTGIESPTSTPEGTADEGSASTTPTSVPEATACTPEQADAVGEGFDKAACFSHGYREETLMLVDDKVWTWEGDHLAAYDAATGAEVFRSDKPKGVTGVHSMAGIEVDGEQMVAVSVAVSDPGDAVTDPTYGWRVLAWPVDAVETGSAASAIDAYVEATDGSALPGADVTFWGDRGVFVNEHYLRYDATEFETYKFIESYKLPKSQDPTPPSPEYVGTSQDLLLGYIDMFDPNNAGDEEYFTGFFAVDASGTEVWNHLASTLDKTTHVAAVWGDYALDITMDQSGDGGEVKWYDAATGDEATPTPDELAGKNVSFNEILVNAVSKAVMVTPDGKYLTFSAYNDDSGDTYNYILDVAGGTITRIDSDIELTAESMIGTTLYATGDGAAIVDLTTGEATAMKSGTAPFAVSDSFGLFTTANGYLLAAPRS